MSATRLLLLLLLLLFIHRYETYHWIHQLDTIVISWIVTRRDHNTNCLSMKLLAAKSRKETDPEDDRVQKAPILT